MEVDRLSLSVNATGDSLPVHTLISINIVGQVALYPADQVRNVLLVKLPRSHFLEAKILEAKFFGWQLVFLASRLKQQNKLPGKIKGFESQKF